MRNFERRRKSVRFGGDCPAEGEEGESDLRNASDALDAFDPPLLALGWFGGSGGGAGVGFPVGEFGW